MTDANDNKLWRIARQRADFRRALYSYIIVIFFMWVIWWMTTGRITGFNGYPWPVWVMLGWGVSLAMQYFKAYHGNQKDLADKEYEKLKQQERTTND
ncbi:MAG: 2TM domain-containing protein [Bacteroidota bacterium]|nr:2TM domain-containing protein [Bacteroidota bacterium]